MILLALDTSARRAALALALADGSVLVAEPDPTERHGRGLVPAIGELLGRAGLRPDQVDGLAVGLGPGSYTGLRVGLMAAKTLAYAIGKPLVGLDSLEVVARNAPADAPRISVVADAQRRGLYVADFHRDEPDGPPRKSGETRVVAIDDWRTGLVPGTLVIGPARGRLASGPPPGGLLGDPAWDEPRGGPLAALAREVWASGRRDDPWTLEPAYLRGSAAEETRAERPPR